MKTARLLFASDWPPVWYEGIGDPSRLWKSKVQVSGLIQNSFELTFPAFLENWIASCTGREGDYPIPLVLRNYILKLLG